MVKEWFIIQCWDNGRRIREVKELIKKIDNMKKNCKKGLHEWVVCFNSHEVNSINYGSIILKGDSSYLKCRFCGKRKP